MTKTNYQAIYDLIAPSIQQPNRLNQFQAALNQIKQGMEEGSIYNPTYKDASDTLKRRVEDFVRNHKLYFGDRVSKNGIYHFTDKMFSLVHVAGFIKDVVKNGAPPAIISFMKDLEVLVPLAADLKVLKGKTVSGRAVQDAKRIEKESKLPKLTPEEHKALYAIFEQLLDKLKTNFVKEQTAFYENIARNAPSVLTREEYRKLFPMMYAKQIMYTKIYEKKEKDKYSPYAEEYKISSKRIDSIIKKQVEMDTREMFESFHQKQTAKMAGILKGRQIQKATIKLYKNLEGDIDFEIVGGDSFTMRNQIVWKTSKLGKPFWQFPTRFTAVNKNGKHFANPTELRMKTEF